MRGSNRGRFSFPIQVSSSFGLFIAAINGVVLEDADGVSRRHSPSSCRICHSLANPRRDRRIEFHFGKKLRENVPELFEPGRRLAQFPFVGIAKLVVGPEPSDTGLAEFLRQNFDFPVEQPALGDVIELRGEATLEGDNAWRLFHVLGAALRVEQKAI